MKKIDWIRKYEDKTGDKHELLPGFQEKYLPGRGYCQYGIDEESSSLIIYETCGDGMFWYDVGLLICKEKKLKHLTTIATRDIKLYLRLFGCKITEETTAEDGSLRLSGLTVYDKPFIAFPAWFDHEKNKYAYYLVTEVGDDE